MTPHHFSPVFLDTGAVQLASVVSSPSVGVNPLAIVTVALLCQFGPHMIWVDVVQGSSFNTLKASIVHQCGSVDQSITPMSKLYLSTPSGKKITTTEQAITANNHGAIVVTTVNTVPRKNQQFTEGSVNSFANLLGQSSPMLTFMGWVGSDDNAPRDHAREFAKAVLQRFRELSFQEME
jgi:hypothetical protein